MLAGRYSVFLAGLKVFWDKILAEVTPSDKIKILELKFSLFDGISILKKQYFEQHILKQLCGLRLQIADVLKDSIDNLDKYSLPQNSV